MHILVFFTLLVCTWMRNMFHDQHVLTNGMYLPFLSFFLSPAQSIPWVYLVWVHSQCGLEVL